MPWQTETAIDVAIIASTSSIIAVLLNQLFSKGNSQRQAARSLIENDIQELGNSLYSMVAHTKVLLDAKTPEYRSKTDQKIKELRIELNVLRGKVRYSLWGLDAGIKAIRSVPVYAAQCINNEKRGIELITLATSVRKSLDLAISDAYAQGSPPSLRRRLFVKYRVWRLQRRFDG
jgi:hypothetical protein